MPTLSKTGLLWQLAWQYHQQHKHHFDSRITALAQVMIFSALLALTLVSSNIQQFLKQDLQQLLGADMVVSSFSPLSQDQVKDLQQQSTAISVQRLLTVTLNKGKRWQRIQLKVVDQAYPLMGEIGVRPSQDQPTGFTQAGPEPGEIWLDPRALASLELKTGDEVLLGAQTFRISGVLEFEPDRLMEGHNVDMRAMIGASSLPDVLHQHPKQQYRYQLQVSQQVMRDIAEKIKAQAPTVTVLNRYSGHPLSRFWKRSENVIGLCFVVILLLAALAIHQAGAGQIKRMSYFGAVCQSQGASRLSTLMMAMCIWIAGLFPLLPLILLLSVSGQMLAIHGLQQQLPGLSLYWDLSAVGGTTGLVMILLLCFQLPGWVKLQRLSVGDQLVRHKDGPDTASGWMMILPSVSILTLVYTDNPHLSGLILLIIFSVLVLMVVLTWGLLALAQKVNLRRLPMLAFSLTLIRQRLAVKASQILALGLGLTLLLMTLMLLTDLQQQILRNTRTHDGNFLITHGTQAHMAPLYQWQKQTGSEIKQMHAYLPGQVTGVNGQHLSDFVSHPSDSASRLERPVRLQLTDTIPDNNQLKAGQYWAAGSQDYQQISVEEEVMEDLGLTLGDRLHFQIYQQRFILKVSGVHEFKAGQSAMTFWFHVPTAMKKQVSQAPLFMGSLELSESGWQALADLWPAVPGMGWVSLQEMTETMTRLLSLISGFIIGFSLLLILMAMLVISAAIQRNITTDSLRNGLLLSMGQSRRHLLQLTLYQSLFTAVVAAGGGYLWHLAYWAIHLPFSICVKLPG